MVGMGALFGVMAVAAILAVSFTAAKKPVIAPTSEPILAATWASPVTTRPVAITAEAPSVSAVGNLTVGTSSVPMAQSAATTRWLMTSGMVSSVGGSGAVTMLSAGAEPPRVPLAVPDKIVPSPEHTTVDAAGFARYRAVAETVGVAPAEMSIESFRSFLADHHMPVYALPKVVEYMDAVAARDNSTGWGWQWAPLRAKDIVGDMSFGKAAFGCNVCVTSRNGVYVQVSEKTAASDFFAAKGATIYARTIPLHALEKVALIEKEFGVGKVAFLVSDYTTEGMVRVDPFLMAVILSPSTMHGAGRFVIDAWDEPGFGIEQATE